MSWPMVALPDVVVDVSGGNTKIPQREYQPQGSLAVVDQGQALVGGYTEVEGARHRSSTPVIVFGDHTRVIKFIDFPFAMGADGVKVLQAKTGWDAKFVFHFLTSIRLPSAGYSRHFKFLKEVQVPKPPIKEQRRIAAILDHADSLTVAAHGRRRLASAFPTSLLKDFSGLPERKLGDVAQVSTGATRRGALPPTSTD